MKTMNNVLSSPFIFSLFLSSFFSALYFVALLFFCTLLFLFPVLFCPLCLLTYFLIFLAVSFCFSNLLSFVLFLIILYPLPSLINFLHPLFVPFLLFILYFYLLFFNWDSLHERLNSHYEAWSYKKTKHKKLKHTGNLFRKKPKLKDVC